MRATVRAVITSALGAACSVALLVPSAAAPPDGRTAPAAALPRTGGLQSLPLQPLDTGARAVSGSDTAAMGLPEQDVEPFSLLGVVWRDATTELHGDVQVRTRSTETGQWSPWRELETHTEHGPDPDSPEYDGETLRGGTAPLWVGESDGVQVRVLPDREADAQDAEHASAASNADLPEGLQLELIDPGDDPAADATEDSTSDAAPEPVVERTDSARLASAQGAWGPWDEPGNDGPGEGETPWAGGASEPAKSAPRPSITSRAGWGADESSRQPNPPYNTAVKTVFVHHTAMNNDYSCSQAPSIIRGIYKYHVDSQGWRDIGYNFLVDRCGTIYEGRAGGVHRAVQGAHTAGFNHNSAGVAVLGNFSQTEPSSAATRGVAQVSAWKLGLDDRNAGGTWKRKSAGNGKYAKGTVVRMHNISGHRDGFATDCPGAQLYARLPAIRKAAAQLQGG